MCTCGFILGVKFPGIQLNTSPSESFFSSGIYDLADKGNSDLFLGACISPFLSLGYGYVYFPTI